MFNINDFKRRSSIEESLQPSANVKRKAGEVPFQSDTDFNGKPSFKLFLFFYYQRSVNLLIRIETRSTGRRSVLQQF